MTLLVALDKLTNELFLVMLPHKSSFKVMSAKQSQESELALQIPTNLHNTKQYDQTNPKHVVHKGLLDHVSLQEHFIVFEDDKSLQGASTFYVQAFCIGPGFYALGHSCFHYHKNDSTDTVKLNFIKFFNSWCTYFAHIHSFKNFCCSQSIISITNW